MSAELVVFSHGAVTVSGETIPFGDPVNPVRTVTIADGRHVQVDSVLVAAGEKVEVWDWHDSDGFEYAAFGIIDDGGYGHIGHRVDPATSGSDETPASTGKWNASERISCFARREYQSDRAYYDATAATEVGDTAGLPTMWTSGSKALGTVSKIAFWNEGASAVRLARVVIQ